MNELEQAMLAADLRESLQAVLLGGWKGHRLGLTEDQTLVLLLPACENLIQSIVRATVR